MFTLLILLKKMILYFIRQQEVTYFIQTLLYTKSVKIQLRIVKTLVLHH